MKMIYGITIKKTDSLPEQLSSYDGSSTTLIITTSNNDMFVNNSISTEEI